MNPCAGFPTYSLSRGAPSPLGYFSMVNSIKNYLASDSGIYKWRRGRDSNSWSLAGSLVFKTSSLNHSDTSPFQRDLYYSTKHRTLSRCTGNFPNKNNRTGADDEIHYIGKTAKCQALPARLLKFTRRAGKLTYRCGSASGAPCCDTANRRAR